VRRTDNIIRTQSTVLEEPDVNYVPKPVDTQHVVLPPHILRLTEALARNAHEVWARQRLADGWRYGASRDDAGKEHPCLVPYEDLPESEKHYDRILAIDTLKTVIALGFDITPRVPPAER
jgi:hypothetical protein